MTPTVSVVIPSYNHEQYIAKALQSVLDQTYQDFEIVIVDDGSSDQTVGQIKKFTDPRIRLFCFKKNRGACFAIDKCIAESRGQYVAVLSSDDVFLPDKLMKQVEFLNHHPDQGAVFSYAQIIDETGQTFADHQHFYGKIFEQPNRTRCEWLRHFFLQGNCLCHPSMLIRKACYDRLGMYDPRYRQLPDFDFWIRLCQVYDITILPEKLMQFRVRAHEENASGCTPQNQIRDAFEHAMILEHYLHISSAEDFFAIFDRPAGASDDPELFPFIVAQAALQQPRRNYWLFALQTLYQLLGNNQIASKLQRQFHFNYNDFFELVAQHDFFNAFPIEKTRLYLDTGQGFREPEVVIQDSTFLYPPFHFDFSLQGQLVHLVRWAPVRDRLCQVHITELVYQDSQGQWHDIDQNHLDINGIRRSDGWIEFETIDPKLTMKIEDQVNQVAISGQWKLTTHEDMVTALTAKNQTIIVKSQEIAAQSQEIVARNQVIAAKNHELAEIYQSRAWQFITKVRAVKGYFKSLSGADK